MGMSWFLQVSPHVLSSQQIIKGERNYPHLNKENWLYHPWTDGIRVLAAWAQQFSLSILYFWAVSGSSDSARQRPLQAKGGRWVLIPLWEGTALPPADTALWSVLWYAQTRKGLYGPDFQKPGMFCVMSFPPPPPPKFLTIWDLKTILEFCVCSFGVLRTLLQAFPPQPQGLKISFPFLNFF